MLKRCQIQIETKTEVFKYKQTTNRYLTQGDCRILKKGCEQGKTKQHAFCGKKKLPANSKIKYP